MDLQLAGIRCPPLCYTGNLYPVQDRVKKDVLLNIVIDTQEWVYNKSVYFRDFINQVDEANKEYMDSVNAEREEQLEIKKTKIIQR